MQKLGSKLLFLATVLLCLMEAAQAQHGRFTDELLDTGGEGLGPVTAVLAVLATVLIVTALLKGSDETNRQAAKPGLIGAAIGAFLGLLIGWPVGMLILCGMIGFFIGYGKQSSL
jgi:chromate transport protein ChrA